MKASEWCKLLKEVLSLEKFVGRISVLIFANINRRTEDGEERRRERPMEITIHSRVPQSELAIHFIFRVTINSREALNCALARSTMGMNFNAYEIHDEEKIEPGKTKEAVA